MKVEIADVFFDDPFGNDFPASLMSEGIVQFLIAFFRDCNDVRGALRQGK